jgi:cytochrome c oxidase subunit 1
VGRAGEGRTVSAVAAPAPAPPRGVVGLVAGTDHKSLGLRIAGLAFFFFVVGGVIALIMRSELAQPGLQVVSKDRYDQLFSMHGSTMVYLFVTPIALALGVYLVPLQVGAPGLSGPRWSLVAFWLTLLAGLSMYAGFLTRNGANKATWIATFPLSDSVHTPGPGMDMWIVGVILAAAGAILLAACVLATIVLRRAPGMTMLRLPVFSWTMVVTTVMVIVAFPALIVAMALLLADRHGASIFESPGGPAAYQHLFWFYGHPVVYVMFFPFVGAVGEVISTFSRRRFFGYGAFVISLLAFTALSISVWAHHMFTTGQVANQYFSLTSTALVLPAGVEYFDLVATMVGGAILLRTPMLFAIGFVLQFLIGGLSGIYVASPTLDYHAHDSYVVVAHFHYTLLAGSAFGLFAGIYYWFPKVSGAFLREGLGKTHFGLMVIGTNLTFAPQFFLGYEGMQRRIADYPASTGWGTLNTLSTVGAFLVALSIAVFLVNVAVSLTRRRAAGRDPWGGQTLEWATTSPPPPHNFDEPLPPIRSPQPLLDARQAEATA